MKVNKVREKKKMKFWRHGCFFLEGFFEDEKKGLVGWNILRERERKSLRMKCERQRRRVLAGYLLVI